MQYTSKVFTCPRSKARVYYDAATHWHDMAATVYVLCADSDAVLNRHELDFEIPISDENNLRQSINLKLWGVHNVA